MKPYKKAEVAGIIFQVIILVLTVLAIVFILLPIFLPFLKIIFNINTKDEEAKKIVEFLLAILDNKELLELSQSKDVELLLPYSGLVGYNIKITKQTNFNKISYSNKVAGNQYFLVLSKLSVPQKTYYLPQRDYENFNNKIIDLSCNNKCYLNVTLSKNQIFIQKINIKK
ncbi:MAG: hypothetical protein QXR30_02780 [Candidatus Woesearchaeota archaeon]